MKSTLYRLFLYTAVIVASMTATAEPNNCGDTQLKGEDATHACDSVIETVDRRIAALQSEIETREVERREALNKVYRTEGANPDDIEAEAEAIEKEYQEKIDLLSKDVAALGAERNQLVEHSTRILLKDRNVD